MIALILLIAVVVIVAGGLEASRRMRFGRGSAAKHHRALDTLGHITNQQVGQDSTVVATGMSSAALHNVRLVATADPTHPRIHPAPIGQRLGAARARGEPGEDGIRLLVPDASADDGVEPSETIEMGAAAAPESRAGGPEHHGEAAAHDGPEHHDEVADHEQPEDHDAVPEHKGTVDDTSPDVDITAGAAAEEAVPEDRELGGDDTNGAADVVEGDDVEGVEDAWFDDGTDRAELEDPAADLPEPLELAEPEPVEMAELAEPEPVEARTPAPVPPAAASPTQEVVVHIEEPWPEPEAQPVVSAAVPDAQPGLSLSGPLGPIAGDEGFRIIVDDEHPVATPRPADPTPWSAFHAARPEETRAQLAALALSGGVDGGTSTTMRTGRTRHRGGRRAPRSADHRRAGVAVAAVAVVGLGGASIGFLSLRHPSAPPHATTARPVAVTLPPTTPPPAASLVSKTSSTATYHLLGSPPISLQDSGPCWMEVRRGNQDGPVLFKGVVSSGQHRDLTGPVWVRLGNPPAVAVLVGGAPLTEPSLSRDNPYNLQFQ